MLIGSAATLRPEYAGQYIIKIVCLLFYTIHTKIFARVCIYNIHKATDYIFILKQVTYPKKKS